MQKSESIKEIATALSRFQAEVTNPKNTADNPFFKSKYAPLNDVLNLVRPLLTKNGLSILQSPSGDGEKIIVTTMLMHSSGEWIELDPLVLRADKVTAQSAGSAITYARRYAVSAILGISSEDDDDGNYATGNNSSEKITAVNQEQPTSKPEQPGPEQTNELPTAKIKALHALRNKLNKTEDEFKQGLSKMFGREITSLKELSVQEADAVIKALNNKLEKGVA